MFNVLLNNLLLIGILVLMYLSSLGINTLLGIYHNLSSLKETFSVNKLITGVIRGGIVLVGALIITVIISLLPEVLSLFGVSAETGLFENLSVVGMGVVMASTIARYLQDAIKKLYVILGKVKEEE